MCIISVKDIVFSYPESTRLVLNHCSFDLRKGEILSILGPNGAGKSTLLNCLCGLLHPTFGAIELNGIPIVTLDRKAIARVCGYVQQYQSASFSYSVFDYVLMGRSPNIGLFQKPTKEDIAIAQEAIETMAIKHLSELLITEISGGERQLAAIARVIAQNPSVILFDEPTAHLDYGNQIRTLKLIKQLSIQGYTIVMTTHTPDHCLYLGGKVALLNRSGSMLYGPCEEIITETKLHDVYNARVSLKYIPEANRIVCIPVEQ